MFVRCGAFFLSCKSRQVPFTTYEGFALHVGKSPDEKAEAKSGVEEDYKRKTVAQLRELLKDKGLKVSGLKSQLIERLKHGDNDGGSLLGYKSAATANQ
jgi:hypothetical protein